MNNVHIGYIKGTHGLKGELIVKPLIEKPERALIPGNTILLNEEKHTIKKVKKYKGNYLIVIDNLIHINLVEHYKGFDVYIDRKDLKLDSNDYLLCDLIGLEVMCDGESFGTVVEAFESPSSNIVKTNYKSLMIPIVDKYVKSIDHENKVIECSDLEELVI